ncbi:MAG: ATP-binding protein [Chlamydiota bacterium]|nr:ATP-binding protein [Chlamydiota bacterium]
MVGVNPYKNLIRERSNSLEEISAGPSWKRRKGVIYDIEAKVKVEADYARIGHNKVWLSEKTFHKLFPNDDINEATYVKVAHYIYEVAFDNNLELNEISVDEVQVDDIEGYIDYSLDVNSINVRTFHENEYTYRTLDKIVINLDDFGPIQKGYDDRNIPKINVDELRELIRENFNSQFFEQGQSLLLNHSIGLLKATVDRQSYVDDPFEHLVIDENNIKHGRLVYDTKIEFRCESCNFEIVMPQNPRDVRAFFFTISSISDVSRKEFGSYKSTFNKANAWKKGVAPLPLCIPLNLACNAIREEIKGVDLSLEDTVSVYPSKDWRLKYSFSKVVFHDLNAELLEFDRFKEDYTKIFRVDSSHKVRLSKSNQCIYTTEASDALLANRVIFTVLKCYWNKNVQENQRRWISYQELLNDIHLNYSALPKKGRCVVNTTQGSFLLELTSANGDAQESSVAKNKSISDLWNIEEKTDIRISVSKALDLELVDNKTEKFLDSIKINVQRVDKKSVISLLMGGKQKKDKILLEEDRLRELLIDNLPPFLFSKQEIRLVTVDGEDLICTVADYNYEGKEEDVPKYGVILKPHADTTIEFTAKKEGSVIISTKPETLDLCNIDQKLKESGVGGLRTECKLFIRDIILSRGEYKERYKKFGVQPERGAIFYGPPGTGKTKLARNLAKLLGVTQDRQLLLTGSKVKSKWVGESEENVRALFQSARQAQQKHGEKSPLYILIIDEIDAILGSRHISSRSYERSLVGSFLSELDGISGEDGESLNNIVVIGLTNDIEVVDEAAKRPGRLGTHIEIGFPDLAGRKEIIEIHVQKFLNNSHIDDAKSVVEWLASKTEGKTGAFIEGVITKAFHFSTGRLAEAGISGEEALKHEAGKITRKDFEAGIKAMDSGRDNILDGMYL